MKRGSNFANAANVDGGGVPVNANLFTFSGSAAVPCECLAPSPFGALAGRWTGDGRLAELRFVDGGAGPPFGEDAWRRWLSRWQAWTARERWAALASRGAPFPRAVWRAALDIPSGATRTYGDLARAAGRPGAARAVGRALAANPWALLVPCHRIVRADGRPGGYRWGVERKAALLAAETRPDFTLESLVPNVA